MLTKNPVMNRQVLSVLSKIAHIFINISFPKGQSVGHEKCFQDSVQNCIPHCLLSHIVLVLWFIIFSSTLHTNL